MHQSRLLGVDERRYPRDFGTFIRFHQDLSRLGPVHELPPSLTLDRFEALIRQHGAGFGVEFTKRAASEPF